jgi:hypothetical protein
MNVASHKVGILGVLFVGGVLWASAGRIHAADSPEYIEPIPEPSPSTTPANGQSPATVVQDESPGASADEGPCADYAGLPVCSPPGRFWLRADYLMWWTSGMNLPPLVTTGTTANPSSTVLFGNDIVNDGGRSGFRTTLGFWLDCRHIWSAEFDYVGLGGQSANFNQFSTGDPILTRPFFDLNLKPPAGAVEYVAFPGTTTQPQVSGSISVAAKDYFQSAGVSMSYNLCSCDSCCDSCNAGCDPCANCCAPTLHCCRTDLLVGFRYYNLSDSVSINETPQTATPVFAMYNITDNFSARNDFYGSELGLRTKVYRGRWSLDILTKLAMGNTHQSVNINGLTIKTTTDGTTTNYAGLLASTTNSGIWQQNTFTMIPQLGLELGYQLSCHWRAYLGYNILYWGSVLRSGDQIDLQVDARNIPWNPAYQPTTALPFPQFPAQATAFWAQGINVGLERRF